MSLDDLFSQIQSGDVKELDIIVKADVQGSVEAVKQSLVNFPTTKLWLRLSMVVLVQSTNLMLL